MRGVQPVPEPLPGALVEHSRGIDAGGDPIDLGRGQLAIRPDQVEHGQERQQGMVLRLQTEPLRPPSHVGGHDSKL
jgi:hypothetical protein